MGKEGEEERRREGGRKVGRGGDKNEEMESGNK